MEKLKLTLGYFYPHLLNIYGDKGNIICLKKRCQWHQIELKIKAIKINSILKRKDCDLFFGGGGQDKQQLIVAKDLTKKKKVLQAEAERGVPMLTICGTYQLFGHYFKTNLGKKIPGISIFDAYTIAGNKRKIGNIIVEINPSIISHQLVGFENHSGNTFIVKTEKNATLALAKVIKGFGNNGQDKTAGAIYKNVVGTYLHGPILPKNPHLADWLIKTALEIKYQRKIKLKPLDDKVEWQAHKAALKLS